LFQRKILGSISKFQISDSKPIPKTKIPNSKKDFDYWIFEFGYFLGFGAWDLEFMAKRNFPVIH
jgi:hypothetical protein